MSNNKEVLKYCPNYYNIVNFDFQSEDKISEKIISIYKSYVFSVDISNEQELDKVSELDRVLASYIHDYVFRSTLKKEIINVKVNRDSNILVSLVNAILKIFVNYEEYTTRQLYISKWI